MIVKRVVYKYIHFIKMPHGIWSCCNRKSGEELGEVKWYAPWRQWVYSPTVQAVYSRDCLADIEDFISQLDTPE